MKLVYSGARFRLYLQRNGISYKQAAEELGIDKNTVGKAVRGGNLGVDTLLRICNTYNLPISTFFTQEGNCDCEVMNDTSANYDISSTGDTTLVADSEEKYKKCEISDVLDMINNTKIMLENLSKKQQ